MLTTLAAILGSRRLWFTVAGLLSLAGCTSGTFSNVLGALTGSDAGVVSPNGETMNEWRARTDRRLSHIEQSLWSPAEQIGAIASSAAVGAAGAWTRNNRRNNQQPNPAAPGPSTPPPPPPPEFPR